VSDGVTEGVYWPKDALAMASNAAAIVVLRNFI
jgi:hypothetical protein